MYICESIGEEVTATTSTTTGTGAWTAGPSKSILSAKINYRSRLKIDFFACKDQSTTAAPSVSRLRIVTVEWISRSCACTTRHPTGAVIHAHDLIKNESGSGNAKPLAPGKPGLPAAPPRAPLYVRLGDITPTACNPDADELPPPPPPTPPIV